jgi:membrane protease YdiL (CAAX protease family)
MNYRRAILLNGILYLVTFLAALGVLALGSDPLSINAPPSATQILKAMIVGIVLTVFGAWWFFRREPATARAGFSFGVIAILVGLVLDGVVSVVLLISGRSPIPLLHDSYTNAFFAVMLALLLLFTSLVGWNMRRRS